MSRTRISHTTAYRYSEPVSFGIHRLVIRPREGHDLQVESLSLKVSPAAAVSWHRDIFGNSIALASFSEPADLLEFSSEAIVCRRDHPSRNFATGPRQPLRPTLVTMPFSLWRRSMNGFIARSAIADERIAACKTPSRPCNWEAAPAETWLLCCSRPREPWASLPVSPAVTWTAPLPALVRPSHTLGRRSISPSMDGSAATPASAREPQKNTLSAGSVRIRAGSCR
jgi:hypothetical protein